MAGTSAGHAGHTEQRIAHYQLVNRVGQGGMGSVYRAHDSRSGATVALKLIHPHLESEHEYVARFEREAYIASLMRSRNVVRVLDSGTADGHHYMACEFIEGVTLSAVIDAGPIDAEEALALTVQVASALDEAYSHQVVHRDIKPDNVILTLTREVKVTDYGIARQSGGTVLTQPGLFVGTLAYSAPERFVGEGDIRSDIYSLGVTLFQMLAGERPYRSDSPAGLMRLHEEQPPPLEMLAEAPASVSTIVRVSLAKDINDRYATPAALMAAIEEARRSMSPVVPPNWVDEALSRFFSRRVVAMAAAGLATIACGASFGGVVTPGAGLVGIGASAGASGVAGASGAGSIAAQAAAGASQGLLPAVLGGGLTTFVAGAVLMVAVAVPVAMFAAPDAFDGAISAITELPDRLSGGDDGSSAAVPGRLPCDPIAATFAGGASSDPAYASEILGFSNAYRAERGAPPLATNPQLEAAAAEYAKFYVENRFWTIPGRDSSPYIHYGADCRDQTDRAAAHGYTDKLVGENVMFATVDVPPPELWAQLLSGRFEDPALLDPRDQSRLAFSETGVACFTRPPMDAGQLAEISCVQVFGEGD